jgi:hypothetical protein
LLNSPEANYEERLRKRRKQKHICTKTKQSKLYNLDVNKNSINSIKPLCRKINIYACIHVE